MRRTGCHPQPCNKCAAPSARHSCPAGTAAQGRSPGEPPHTAVLRLDSAPVRVPMGNSMTTASSGMTARPRHTRCAGGAKQAGKQACDVGAAGSRCYMQMGSAASRRARPRDSLLRGDRSNGHVRCRQPAAGQLPGRWSRPTCSQGVHSAGQLMLSGPGASCTEKFPEGRTEDSRRAAIIAAACVLQGPPAAAAPRVDAVKQSGGPAGCLAAAAGAAANAAGWRSRPSADHLR